MADGSDKNGEPRDDTPAVALVVSDTPRFFIELNEPFSVFGMNPEGLAVPFLASAIFIGLGFWMGVLFALLGGVYLCRKMAANPTIIKEMIARYHRSKHVVPNPEDGTIDVRVVCPEGNFGVGQWLARRVHLQVDATAVKSKRRRV